MKIIRQSGRKTVLKYLLSYLSVSTLFICLVGYAANGPRGSDQFWYLSDVETLLNNNPPLTNTLFPGTMVRENIPIGKSYFLHHTPALYMVVPFAKCFGAYHGWIVLNILVGIAGASCVAYTVSMIASARLAVFAFSMFLLLPAAFWQSSNVLQESVFSFLMALIILLIVLSERFTWAWFGFIIATVLSSLFHPIFFVMAFAGLIYFFYSMKVENKESTTALIVVAIGLVALFGIKVMQPVWFPSGFQPSLKAIMLDSIPGNKMAWHLNLQLPDVTTALLLDKVIYALKHQFGFSSLSIFFWPANIMLVFLAFLPFCKREIKVKRLIFICVIILIPFCGMVVLHQNQFRYQLFVLPVLIVVTAYVLNNTLHQNIRRKVATVIFGIVFASLLSVDMALAMHMRADGNAFQRAGDAAVEIMRDHVEEGDRILVVYHSHVLFFAHLAAPSKCLLLPQAGLDQDQLRSLNKEFGAKWLFCDSDSEYKDAFHLKNEYRGFKEFFSNFSLYRLE